ncbi:hypothetical protein KUTeg_019254 [Tegillarca granosa]|uniref:Uncharacterized protein n=1 Tax=Tegillarca granosa TaxID=220873 RepID=A0ABQ9EC07_TEGGR|nr:hypothetical protein KUTeg_019254 [Tegillarca granosa]
MERDEAEATGSRMLRPRKQTGGQKKTRKSPQPTSRNGKDHKRRCPQTVGRKRQKVSVTTLPPPSSDSSSDSEVEVAHLGNEVFRRSSVHQVTQNNMAAPINSGVNTGNTSYSTVTFLPNLVNLAQLATGAQYQNVQMALDLLKYCSTIRWAASKVPGPAWRQYDEQFRLRRAKKHSKSWARLDLDLWLFASRSHCSVYCLPFFEKSIVSNCQDSDCCPKPYKNFLVNKLLEGLRRSGKSKDIRAPITLRILTQLPRALVCICLSSYEAKLFHAAFTFAFFGFLRVGEIALSNCKLLSSTVLSISNISIQTSMLKVKIRFSKTDQFGKTTTLYFDSVPSSVVCPVNAMKAYLSVRPAAILKKCLKLFNLPTQQFKSYSFRIGAASLASMKNIPPNVIQSWGRWKSDAYRGYIHIWIVVSSIVYWAQSRALIRPVNRNLGLEKYGVQIRWCGIRGMK